MERIGTMFAKVTNGQIDQYPYTVGDLRRDNPNTSFSWVLSDETLAEYGLVSVQRTAAPDVDALTHRVRETSPVLQGGGWVQQWAVEPYADAADRVREERNRRLAASDWTQVADAPGDKTAWAAYRQALRQLPEQAGFPRSVVWPAPPEIIP
jgi:hypothetical protein